MKTPRLLALCLLALLAGPAAHGAEGGISIEALRRLKGMDMNANPKLKAVIERTLTQTRGTPEFVELVEDFNIPGQEAGLLEVAHRHPDTEAGTRAMKRLLTMQDTALIEAALRGTNADLATRTALALGNSGERQTAPLLLPLVTDVMREPGLRKQCVRSLARIENGATALLALARDEKLPADLKLTASGELNAARWPAVKQQAAELLPLPQGRNATPLPPVGELVKRTGDAVNGAKVFAKAEVGCATCHRVRGSGVDFGPDLSEIGTKLGRDAIYDAILDPGAGVSFGFEGWTVLLKNGDEAFGLMASQTAEEVAIKAVGGIVTRYPRGDIRKLEQARQSVMPGGLAGVMTEQELVDLVEYLATLKK